MSLFAPDREKIFEDTEAGDACDVICPLYHRPDNDPKKPLSCMASAHYQCPLVARVAGEINSFIADNDDAFMYIKTI